MTTQPDSSTVEPPVKTYHCAHCTHLLLATTHVLSSLPTRKPPALDGALILPLPSPRSDPAESEDEDSEPDHEPEERAETEPGRPGAGKGRREASRRREDVGYSILLSTAVDRKAVIIRREDGFEKRLLLRCGRCKIVVGYRLDEGQFRGRVGDGGVIYLLKGGLLGTEDMASGKKGGEEKK